MQAAPSPAWLPIWRIHPPTTRVGAADRVHRDRLRIAGEGFAAEIAAPADIARPGGAVGAARAVAAGAHGVLGGASREVGELVGPPGGIGDDQIPEPAVARYSVRKARLADGIGRRPERVVRR